MLEFSLRHLMGAVYKSAPNQDETLNQAVLIQFAEAAYPPVINKHVRPISKMRLYKLKIAISHSSSPAIH